MASKGRMGIQVDCWSLHQTIMFCFNGQQRPDGDSGSFADTPKGKNARFQWPAKAGWGFRQGVNMANRYAVKSFQWPAKAGWGFR